MQKVRSDAAGIVESELVGRAFMRQLTEHDLHALLSHLNAQADYRFTGVYRFTPGLVMSVALWDREAPNIQLGADVKMKESYCWLTGLGGDSYVIEDAACDPRLDGHAAQHSVRAYTAVVLRDAAGAPWGTLCHFDFAPRKFSPAALRELERFRPLIEEIVVRESAAQWDPA